MSDAIPPPPTDPALPTYKTAAEVLEKKNGSGIRLAGWTVARTVLLLPGYLVVGVTPKKALIGSLFSSALISTFTLLRVYNAGYEQRLYENVVARYKARKRIKRG